MIDDDLGMSAANFPDMPGAASALGSGPSSRAVSISKAVLLVYASRKSKSHPISVNEIDLDLMCCAAVNNQGSLWLDYAKHGHHSSLISWLSGYRAFPGHLSHVKV